MTSYSPLKKATIKKGEEVLIKRIVAKLVLPALLTAASISYGSNSCVKIIGSYPNCKLIQTVMPGKKDKMSNLTILKEGEVNFEISMTFNDELSKSNFIADGISRVVNSNSGPIEVKAICKNNVLTVHTKQGGEELNIEGGLVFSKEKEQLIIKQVIFEDVWQTFSCVNH